MGELESFSLKRTAASLILIFLVSGFMSRSFVDSSLRDHVFQQFLFIVGLFTLIASNLDCSEA